MNWWCTCTIWFRGGQWQPNDPSIDNNGKDISDQLDESNSNKGGNLFITIKEVQLTFYCFFKKKSVKYIYYINL